MAGKEGMTMLRTRIRAAAVLAGAALAVTIGACGGGGI
jgi:hypothetical protein